MHFVAITACKMVTHLYNVRCNYVVQFVVQYVVPPLAQCVMLCMAEYLVQCVVKFLEPTLQVLARLNRVISVLKS